jgi:hypothetical protein
MERKYPIIIPRQYQKIIAVFKKDEKFTTRNVLDIITKNVKKEYSDKRLKSIIEKTISFGKLAGIFEKEDFWKTTFKEFCSKLEISSWINSLRGSHFNHPEACQKSVDILSTQETYGYDLWHFDEWLVGKTLTIQAETIISDGMYKKESKSIEIKGVIHFLQLLIENTGKNRVFSMMVKHI